MKQYKKLYIVSFLRIDKVISNRSVLEWIDAILFALIVVSIFRTWFFSPYRVPTGSMIHTIERGDFLFANMHAYGYIVPFTKKKFFSKPIQRQDIAIFPYPVEPSVNFIKRVIGLPGDKLEIIDEVVYINDKELDESYKFLDNLLPKGEDFSSIVIPQGKYFMMGDNRRNSQDSRYWGYVDKNTIRGRGWFVFWSHDPKKNLFSGYNIYRIGQILR